MQKVFIVMPEQDMFEDEIDLRSERLLVRASEYFGEPLMLLQAVRDDKQTALEHLGERIKRMAGADYVLFAKGWDAERGCKIEMACALQYNKKILLEDGDIIQEVK